jgi:hypothetical protein
LDLAGIDTAKDKAAGKFPAASSMNDRAVQ